MNRFTKLLTSLILATPRGHFISIAWERDAKVKKGCPHTIRKRVEGRARIGIDYENVRDVKDSRADGSLPETPNNGRKPWFHYPEGMFPFIAEHNTNGNRYVCLYFAKGDTKTAFLRSCWIMDGEIVPFDAVAPYVLAAEKPKATDKTDNTFRPMLDNVTRYIAEGKAINWTSPDYKPVPDDAPVNPRPLSKPRKENDKNKISDGVHIHPAGIVTVKNGEITACDVTPIEELVPV